MFVLALIFAVPGTILISRICPHCRLELNDTGINSNTSSLSVLHLSSIYVLHQVFYKVLNNVHVKIMSNVETQIFEIFLFLILIKELSLCHKLKFSNPYIFLTGWRRPLIFQTYII